MSALNTNGKPVSVGDSVSIIGTVVSFTGTGPKAQVTVQTQWTTATFVAQANDMNAVQHSADASHPCTSISGKAFGAANDAVTVLGKVTAISGSGETAILTVTLTTSQASISVPAGACQSDNA